MASPLCNVELVFFNLTFCFRLLVLFSTSNIISFFPVISHCLEYYSKKMFFGYNLLFLKDAALITKGWVDFCLTLPLQSKEEVGDGLGICVLNLLPQVSTQV